MQQTKCRKDAKRYGQTVMTRQNYVDFGNPRLKLCPVPPRKINMYKRCDIFDFGVVYTVVVHGTSKLCQFLISPPKTIQKDQYNKFDIFNFGVVYYTVIRSSCVKIMSISEGPELRPNIQNKKLVWPLVSSAWRRDLLTYNAHLRSSNSSVLQKLETRRRNPHVEIRVLKLHLSLKIS